MNCLIIGGTSGLGLSLARSLQDNYEVYVTGRRDFSDDVIKFVPLDLSATKDLANRVKVAIDKVPQIDLLVYAAGFFQEGTITDLSEEQIDTMLAVGLTGAVYVIREVLTGQETLPELVAITSTSQWTPRLNEPVYTAVKAGLGALANSLSLDLRIGKVLVAGPAGMATDFWHDTDPKAHDTTKMLSADWVAQAINQLRQGEYAYKFARILREPSRVEIVETRE